MINDIEKVLLSKEDISKIVHELGSQISKDYAGKNLLLISILKGSVVFTSDLMREITIPCKIDFMAVSSYGNSVSTSGVVKIVKDLEIPIDGYDVLIIEDILDSGRTLKYVSKMLSSRNPNSVKICALLDNPTRRQVELNADYVGTEIPNKFVVGYGLDYDEKYRNLPYIGILKSEIYNG